MNKRFELVNGIMEETLELPPRDREMFLAERCGVDKGLLAEARRLLAISASMDGFLDHPPASASEIYPGLVLGGRFRILEELGAGATGKIFLAEDSRLGEVALKILHPELRHDARAMERFLAEIQAGRAIGHPNVCPVFDFFVFDQGPHDFVAAITMKRLRGETLAYHLSQGAIPLQQAIHIAIGIAKGIDALHAQGVIHRDLKPDNIMLTRGPGGAVVPVIMDFGLASIEGTKSAGKAAEISGSPDYMAPEQFRVTAVSSEADIYAFGLIVFEMIAGVRPFPQEDLLPAVIRRTTEDAPRVSALAPGTPQVWDKAIALALSRDPSKRPRSAKLLLDLVEQDATSEAARLVRIGGRCHHRSPAVRKRFHRQR